MPRPTLVFVYGTLRQGGENHFFLTGQELLGSHRTSPQYTMLDIGLYPGVVSGGDVSIVGEVWRVSSSVLDALDRLEDYPETYTRDRIATPWGAAWIYLYHHEHPSLPHVRHGDWFNR